MTKYILPFLIKEIFMQTKKGYLEIYKNKIIVTFGSGKTIYLNKDNLNKGIFGYKTIPNNLLELDLFNQKINWTGLKI